MNVVMRSYLSMNANLDMALKKLKMKKQNWWEN